MKNAFVYIDDQILSGDEAKISLFDLSFLRGFGIFDYMRTYQKVPFHLWDHLKRFKASAETLEIPLQHTLEEIAEIIEMLLGRVSYPEAGIKIFLTGGSTPDQFLPEENPKFVAMIFPVITTPQSLYERGIHLLTENYLRPFPTCKSIHYLKAVTGVRSALKRGFDDILYLDHYDQILETGTANFFAIKGDTILTGESDILLGITRKVVIDLIQKNHFSLEIRSLTKEEIPTFDGAFLTASNKPVLPVTKINQHTFKIHPLALHLKEAFSAYTKIHTEMKIPSCASK